MSSEVRDKGSGKIDWEKHSLRYVANAINSAQRRQQRLWNKLFATRSKDGLIAVDWPVIEEFVESVRRTHAMMVDLETVAGEYERKHHKAGRKARARSKPSRARPRKKK